MVTNGNVDVYDFENRLILRTKADGTVIDYLYDANGQRVQKQKSSPGLPPVTHGYLIDSQSPSGWPQCVAEVQFTGSATSAPNPFILQPSSFILSATYTYGPQGPISQWTATQGEHYFLLDAHGSVRAHTDATGIAPFPSLHHHCLELLG